MHQHKPSLPQPHIVASVSYNTPKGHHQRDMRSILQHSNIKLHFWALTVNMTVSATQNAGVHMKIIQSGLIEFNIIFDWLQRFAMWSQFTTGSYLLMLFRFKPLHQNINSWLQIQVFKMKFKTLCCYVLIFLHHLESVHL